MKKSRSNFISLEETRFIEEAQKRMEENFEKECEEYRKFITNLSSKIGPGWRELVNNELQDPPLTMPVLKEQLYEIFFGWQDNPSPVWISKEQAEMYVKMMGYNNLEEYLNMKEKHEAKEN